MYHNTQRGSQLRISGGRRGEARREVERSLPMYYILHTFLWDSWATMPLDASKKGESSRQSSAGFCSMAVFPMSNYYFSL